MDADPGPADAKSRWNLHGIGPVKSGWVPVAGSCNVYLQGGIATASLSGAEEIRKRGVVWVPKRAPLHGDPHCRSSHCADSVQDGIGENTEYCLARSWDPPGIGSESCGCSGRLIAHGALSGFILSTLDRQSSM